MRLEMTLRLNLGAHCQALELIMMSYADILRSMLLSKERFTQWHRKRSTLTTYEHKSGAWEVVREKSSDMEVWCVIENVMYSCTYSGCLRWYDYEAKEWREIKGLEYLREDRTYEECAWIS